MRPNPLFSAGERVVLACWLAVLFVVWGYLRFGLVASPSPCAVVAQPAVSLWPLRALRASVIVDPSPNWREATLSLYDPDGELLRSSLVWSQAGGVLAPRHTPLEWSTLPPAEPGDYLVVLRVSTVRVHSGCDARAIVHVADPH